MNAEDALIRRGIQMGLTTGQLALDRLVQNIRCFPSGAVCQVSEVARILTVVRSSMMEAVLELQKADSMEQVGNVFIDIDATMTACSADSFSPKVIARKPWGSKFWSQLKKRLTFFR